MTPRVVFDSMVFLQQAARPERLHTTFASVWAGGVELHISDALLAEVHAILTRPRHREKFPAFTPSHTAAFLDRVRSVAVLAQAVPTAFGLSPHPDDDHVFNLAIAVKAHYLVTWETRHLRMAEKHPGAFRMLLELAPELRIVDPPTFARSVTPAS